MQVLLKIPVTLCGITYGRGQHEIPPEATVGWFFEGLKSDGNLIDLTKKVEKPHSEEKDFKLVVEDEPVSSTKKHKRKSKKKHQEVNAD